MNDTEKRELDVWLHEALGNCAHEWRCDIVWKENGKYLYNSGQVNATCKKCGATTEDTFTSLEDLQAPDYTGKDWIKVAEAMRKRGCPVVVYFATEDYFAEVHGKARSDDGYPVVHRRHSRDASGPGEAVALASKSALEAEVS